MVLKLLIIEETIKQRYKDKLLVDTFCRAFVRQSETFF